MDGESYSNNKDFYNDKLKEGAISIYNMIDRSIDRHYSYLVADRKVKACCSLHGLSGVHEVLPAEGDTYNMEGSDWPETIRLFQIKARRTVVVKSKEKAKERS